MKKTSFEIGAIFYAALCFFTASTAHAAITFDASSTARFLNATTAASGTTITVGTGNNEALIICQTYATNQTAQVYVQSNPATLIATATNVSLWYYLGGNITTSTWTVSSSFSGSSANLLGISSFFGVQQGDPIDLNTTVVKTTATPSSTNTMLVPNEYMIDCLRSAEAVGNTLTPNAGQTATTQWTTTTPVSGASYKPVTTDQATSTGWTAGLSAATDYINAGLVPAITQTSTITLLATSTASVSVNSPIPTNLTSTITTVSGSNTILLLFAAAGGNTGGDSVISASFNGTALTPISADITSAGGGHARAFYELNPPVGTYIASTTFGSTTQTSTNSFFVEQWSGVNQTTPFDATSSVSGVQNPPNGNGYAGALMVPAYSGDMGADVVYWGTTALLNPYGTSLIATNPIEDSYEAGQNSTASIPLTHYINYGHWIGVLLAPAPAGGNATGTPDWFVNGILKLFGELFIR